LGGKLKQSINLGAYGWLHTHWLVSFYPEDLPQDWQLGYYSNEFNTVLVPADYWQNMPPGECEQWLDDVHPDFEFYIECHSRMFESVSLDDLTRALSLLKPQLSALVFLDEQKMSEAVKRQFDVLVDRLELEVIGYGYAPGAQMIWRSGSYPAEMPELPPDSSFAFIEDELLDMRSARALIQPFTERLSDAVAESATAAMIIHHPQLQAANLAKFRSVLEIMGH
jgi:hypothetical protein